MSTKNVLTERITLEVTQPMKETLVELCSLTANELGGELKVVENMLKTLKGVTFAVKAEERGEEHNNEEVPAKRRKKYKRHRIGLLKSIEQTLERSANPLTTNDICDRIAERFNVHGKRRMTSLKGSVSAMLGQYLKGSKYTTRFSVEVTNGERHFSLAPSYNKNL